MELDDKICYCFHISKRKVLNYIRIHQPRVPSQISDCGGAGTGCGWCVPFLKRYFAEQRGDADVRPGDEPDKESYARQRGRYLQEGKGTPPPGAEPPPPQEEG